MPQLQKPLAERQTLHNCLSSVLAGRPHRSAVQHLVNVAKRMALAYLHTKARMGTLDPARFGMSFEDMATDSIADLFARDEHGRYIELCEYFESTAASREGTPVPMWDEPEVEMALRRIVFGKVNERLFRSYKENDPNLGKVIRNIKDAVSAVPHQRLERIGGRQWIVFGADAPLEGDKPLAPAETVESYVTSALGRLGQTAEAVAALETFLGYHPYYRNGYPVSAFAKLVRSAFIRLGAAMTEDSVPGEDSFTEDEVEQAIEAAIDAVRERTYSTYVATRKIDETTFDLYVRTVSDVLASEFVHGTSSQNSHFDVMAVHRPSLSKSDYRRRHRNRVEYMVKMARANLSELFADDYLA